MEIARRSSRLRFAVPAHDRVQHVEAHVEHGQVDRRAQHDPLRFHLVGQPHFSPAAVFDGLVETVRADSGQVVVALKELAPARDALLLQAEDRPVDERHGAPPVVQVSLPFVSRLPLFRVGLAAEIRVALQHHPQIRIVFGQHVRAGADRVPMQRQVALCHARLLVKYVRLPRHRCEKTAWPASR